MDTHEPAPLGWFKSATRVSGHISLRGDVTLEHLITELPGHKASVTQEAKQALLFARNADLIPLLGRREAPCSVEEIKSDCLLWEAQGSVRSKYGDAVRPFTLSETIEFLFKAVTEGDIALLKGKFVFWSTAVKSSFGRPSHFGFLGDGKSAVLDLHFPSEQCGLPFHLAFSTADNVQVLVPKKR